MKNHFRNFRSLEDLHDGGFTWIPNEKGIYIVIKPKNIDGIFSLNTTAIAEYKGKSMLYSIDELLSKFEQSDKEILYIGKAGGNANKLKQRIEQFVKYGYGLVDNHRGGRAIWQMENNKKLLLGFVECNNPEKKEKELLSEYCQNYGVLPVANRKIGEYN